MENKKYFVVSDIHSYLQELKTWLSRAGFRKSDKNHILIICGDLFDRGYESLELYQYLKTIPKKRLVLIKGNHETLLEELLCKSWPDSHDFSNGTVRTCCSFANIDEKLLNKYYWFEQYMQYKDDWSIVQEKVVESLQETWNTIVKNVKESEFYKWFKAADWKDYYELNNLILVHSFIPVKCDNPIAIYRSATDFMEPMPDWRTKATEVDFDDARWGCPYKQFNAGLFDHEIANNKTLVCGHWRTKDAHQHFGTRGGRDGCDIYYSKHLIMLDASTPSSFKVNVLVVDGNDLFDQYGNKLNQE